MKTKVAGVRVPIDWVGAWTATFRKIVEEAGGDPAKAVVGVGTKVFLDNDAEARQKALDAANAEIARLKRELAEANKRIGWDEKPNTTPEQDAEAIEDANRIVRPVVARTVSALRGGREPILKPGAKTL